MPSLEAAAHYGESLLQTDTGMDFYGTIMAVSEGSIPSYDMNTPRNFLHVAPDSFIEPGVIIYDVFGRKFLTATHDSGQISNRQLYNTFRLYNVNTSVVWSRISNLDDPLTGLKKSAGAQVNLGIIWVSMEMITREEIDLTFRVKEQSYQVITNQPLQLNDYIDDKIVKRVDPILGVYRAEVQ